MEAGIAEQPDEAVPIAQSEVGRHQAPGRRTRVPGHDVDEKLVRTVRAEGTRNQHADRTGRAYDSSHLAKRGRRIGKEHQRHLRYGDVELRIAEWQRCRITAPPVNVGTNPSGHGEHGVAEIGSRNRASTTDSLRRHPSDDAGTARHVKDTLAVGDPDRIEQPRRPLSKERGHEHRLVRLGGLRRELERLLLGIGHRPSLCPGFRAGIGQLTHSGPATTARAGDNAGVEVEKLISAGASALNEGRWRDAQSAFETALTAGSHPVALDGLGEAFWWLGDPRRSNELREQAYARFRRQGDSTRAILAALGVAVTYEANFGNNQAAMGWVARAGRLLNGEEDPLAAWVWGTRAYLTTELATAIHLYERALAAARATKDIDLELWSMSGLGERLVLSGEVATGMSLIDEAMAGTLGGEYTRLDTVVFTSCDMLVACDAAHDLERASRWCEIADRFIATYGCPFLYARCRTIYGGLLVTTGRWPEAERELAMAIDMSAGAGPPVSADAHARMADLRLRQGRIEEAVSLLSGHEDQTRAQLAAAAVRLARGDPAGAVALLRRRLAKAIQGQIGSAPALALLVRASLELGEIEAAREAAQRLAVLATGQGSAHIEALAALSEGYVSIAMDECENGVARLETALGLFVSLGMPHEAARARLELARALANTQPDAAISEAESALATFDRIGARSDADATAALLRTLGVTPPSSRHGDGELTGRERQVLVLLAVGLSNPEIAARLHISRKTVAHHVSSVLTKLGVRNRTEAVARAGTATASRAQR